MQPDLDVPPTQQSLMRRFFGDGAIYAATGVLSQGIAFLLFPFFAHVFSPSEFGIIDLLAVVTVLVNLTIALEISQGLGRHVAEARSDADRRAYASTALVFSAVIYTVFLVVVLALAPQITDAVLGDDVDPSIMRVAVCATWASGLLYLAQDLLRWRLRPRQYAAVPVTTAVVTTVTAGVLILGFGVGVTGAFVAQLLGGLVAGALAFWFGRDLFRLTFDRSKLREMLAFSLPLVPASIGVFLNGYADRLVIQSQMTLTDVGIYGVAFRMSVIVGLVLLAFQGALMPLVLTRHHEPHTPLELARIFRLFCGLALAVVLLVSLSADALVALLTPPDYAAAADIVPFLVAGAFFAGMYIFAPGLNIAKRTVPFALITLGAGVANVVVAFALVGPLGIAGPALAFACTAAVGFAVLMSASQRLYPVPHDWPRLLACGAGIGILVAAGRLVSGDDAVVALVRVVLALIGLLVLARFMIAFDERPQIVALLRRLRRTPRPVAPTP